MNSHLLKDTRKPYMVYRRCIYSLYRMITGIPMVEVDGMISHRLPRWMQIFKDCLVYIAYQCAQKRAI